jgi:hypothetical protein
MELTAAICHLIDIQMKYARRLQYRKLTSFICGLVWRGFGEERFGEKHGEKHGETPRRSRRARDRRRWSCWRL